jgi:hypothetical protein
MLKGCVVQRGYQQEQKMLKRFLVSFFVTIQSTFDPAGRA